MYIYMRETWNKDMIHSVHIISYIYSHAPQRSCSPAQTLNPKPCTPPPPQKP